MCLFNNAKISVTIISKRTWSHQWAASSVSLSNWEVGANYTESRCTCVPVYGSLPPLGRAVSGVMTEYTVSGRAVLKTESIMSGWVARRRLTWQPAIAPPFALHAFPIAERNVVLVWLLSVLPNRWVDVCLCTVNGCLIIIPHQVGAVGGFCSCGEAGRLKRV